MAAKKSRSERDQHDGWRMIMQGRLTSMVLVELMQPLAMALGQNTMDSLAEDPVFLGKVQHANYIYQACRLVDERRANEMLAKVLGGATWQSLQKEQEQEPEKPETAATSTSE